MIATDRLDLFVSRYLDWDLDKSRWCGEGEGAPRSYCHPREFGKVSSSALPKSRAMERLKM